MMSSESKCKPLFSPERVPRHCSLQPCPPCASCREQDADWFREQVDGLCDESFDNGYQPQAGAGDQV